MLRMLDYNLDGIGMPLKVYLFTSLDGKEYRLASIKDTPFPNNRHDAWIENLLFDQLDESIRYMKGGFRSFQTSVYG